MLDPAGEPPNVDVTVLAKCPWRIRALITVSVSPVKLPGRLPENRQTAPGANGDSPATRLARWLRSALQMLRSLTRAPRFRGAVALETASWALQLATYHLVARALHLPVTTGTSFVLLLAVNLGFVVRLTPGSIGVLQFAYATTAVALGLPREAAVAAALLLQAIQVLPVTLLGITFTPELL